MVFDNSVGCWEIDNPMLKNRTIIVVAMLVVFATGCLGRGESTPVGGSNQPVGETGRSVDQAALSQNNGANSSENSPPAAVGEPKTIRDFFMLLPEKYFVLESCEKEKDKDCKKAKVEYLKTFTEVEDTANGYLKGGCDGAQSCLEMTIFKRPDSTYLVAVSTEGEMIIEQHFLDYAGGKWTDVGAQVIPEFSKKNIYELPRKGTTMTVFSKKIIEKGDDYEVAEKGSRLYSLVWKDGKFSKSK